MRCSGSCAWPLPRPWRDGPRRPSGLSLRVAIVGAGIVGVTTAYELALQGHEVVVYESRASVASEASFANAGLLAPARGAMRAVPGTPWAAWRQLLGGHSPVRLAGIKALAQWPWLWRRWQAGRAPACLARHMAIHRLAQLSRARTLELTRTLHLEFEQAPGYVMLLRGERELQAAQPGLALLREWGVPHDVVDAARCRLLEPGLRPDTALLAGVHLPQDGVGNCRQFAHLLKAEAQRLGARFRFDTSVRALRPGTAPALVVDGGAAHVHDAVLVCAGVRARALLDGVGLRLPLVAVHGYSVTAPLRHLEGAAPPGPRAAVTDERFGVTITRLGQRIRVTGGTEIGGSPGRMAHAPLRTLYRVLDDWFAGAALTRDAQPWKGARPLLPDGAPVLGASGAPGIWLNLGHGASGWLLACGSARVLAERIAGRDAPVDVSELSAARLR